MQWRFIRVFHPTGRIPSPADRGCRTKRVRAVPSWSIHVALADGPAGSPILIHSITADNDRLNGPPSLDELRCAPAASRAPGILLGSRTSPSNLIQSDLGRVKCCQTIATAMCFSLCCSRYKKKRENCFAIFFEIPRDDKPTNIWPRCVYCARLWHTFLSRSPRTLECAFEKKEKGKNNVKLDFPLSCILIILESLRIKIMCLGMRWLHEKNHPE